MAEIGADGVNGDTFDGVPRAYRTASDETGHPLVFEPEGAPRADERPDLEQPELGLLEVSASCPRSAS